MVPWFLELRHRRSIGEAAAFYVVFLIVGGVVAAGLGGLAGLFDPSAGFDQGLKLGELFAIVVSPVLALAVLRAKALLGNPIYLGLALLAGVAAALGGFLLSLLVVAFLLTREPAPLGQGALS